MKNLKQIENMLKAQGLTGDEFKIEYEQQCLLFGRRMIDEILSGVGMSNFTYVDAAFYLAQISEIFVEAARYDFPHDFAEHFQIEVFNRSPQHTNDFCDWSDKTFDAPKSAEPESVGTSAAYQTEKPLSVQPDIETENVALLISGLLTNPNVPQRIQDGVTNVLDEMEGVDKTEIDAFWKSPEYVGMVLRGIKKGEENDNEN